MFIPPHPPACSPPTTAPPDLRLVGSLIDEEGGKVAIKEFIRWHEWYVSSPDVLQALSPPF